MSPDALRRPTPFLFSRGVKAADAALWAVNIRQLSRIGGENLSPREKKEGRISPATRLLAARALRSGRLRGAKRVGAKKASAEPPAGRHAVSERS